MQQRTAWAAVDVVRRLLDEADQLIFAFKRTPARRAVVATGEIDLYRAYEHALKTPGEAAGFLSMSPHLTCVSSNRLR